MASEPKKSKLHEEKTVSGYIHNVSVAKLSLRKNKYFNAVIQVSREDFHEVAIFKIEKRNVFVQAQNCKTAVQLTGITKQPSRSGEGIDILFGKFSELTVLKDLPFPCRDPPLKSKRTVVDIKKMAPRQQIGGLTGRIVHLTVGTKTVEFQGRQLETQSATLQDNTGYIRVQLWEGQVGSLSYGTTYQLTQLSTREFNGELFVTTTKETTVKETQPLPGLGPITPFDTKKDPVTSISGTINRAEVIVSRSCGNCRFWQQDFEPKKKFHRCENCKMLQKTSIYNATATAHVNLSGEHGDCNLNINNSVLQKYLANLQLTHLLEDAQNIEEYFLECGQLTLNIQNDTVVDMHKLPEPTAAPQSESSAPADAHDTEVPAK